MSTPNPDDDLTVIRPRTPRPDPAPAQDPAAAAVPLETDTAAAGQPPVPAPEPTPVRAPEPADAAPPDPAQVQPRQAPGRDQLAEHGSALPAGTRVGEFEITGLVGQGGFGIVYRARHHALGHQVAIKEYMPSALAVRQGATHVQVLSERHRDTFEAGRKSFFEEAKALFEFDHPSLVKVYHFWEGNGTAYMAMPFYEGVTLKDRLREMGTPPDEDWLMGLLAPLTEALAVIHAKDWFHRDIAPDNVILLAGTERPLLLDFGAARRVIGDMTQALTVILKPGYAPLEQYAELPDMKQGPWTDIYALAASVYFAIRGSTPPPSVSRVVNDRYQPLAQACAGRYSARFLQAIDKALNVRPENRTRSIDELRADLGLGPAMAGATAQGSVPRTVARTAHGPLAAATPSRSRVPMFAGIVAAVLALAGGGAWLASSGGRSPAPAPSASPAPAAVVAPASAVATVTAPATAPVPPPAAPAPLALPARFDVLEEFDRVVQAQSGGLYVEATMAKTRLRIGRDRLNFSLKSNLDGDVTVLVLGPDGSLVRLMPNRATPRIRIKAGQTLHLPPGDVGIEVSEPAGAENFLVIVSAQQRQYGALGGRVEGGYLALPGTDVLGARAAARGAAAPSVLLGEAPPGCSSAHCDDYAATRFTLDVVR